MTRGGGYTGNVTKKSFRKKKGKLEGKEFRNSKGDCPFLIIIIFASALENQPGADDQK